MAVQARGLRIERSLVLGRDHERQRLRLLLLLSSRPGRDLHRRMASRLACNRGKRAAVARMFTQGGCFLENHMRVRAARPKRKHTATARVLSIHNPTTLPIKQLHRPGRPVDVCRGLLAVQRPGQHAVLKGLHHLNHTGHTSRRLRMTNIGLDRAQIKRSTLTLLTIRRDDRLRLDRITQRRPSTMRLNHIDIQRRQTRARQSLSDNPFLRRPIRSRQPITRTILIHRRPTNKRKHTMTPLTRIRQPLQHNKTHTLRKTSPIRTRRKRLTTPIDSQTTLTRKEAKHARRRHYGNAPGQSEPALLSTQCLGC